MAFQGDYAMPTIEELIYEYKPTACLLAGAASALFIPNTMIFAAMLIVAGLWIKKKRWEYRDWFRS